MNKGVRVESAAHSCVLCGGATTKQWKRGGILSCGLCKLLLRETFPGAEDLIHLYQAGWQEPEAHRTETGATSRVVAASYVECLKQSLTATDFSGMTFLEFGAGSGEMMLALSAAGAEVTGVDPFSVEHLKSRGLNAYGDLGDVPAGVRFDGILAFNVIEHLSEPRQLAEVVRTRLAPGGWTLWATPNASSLNARLNRWQWREMKTPGHLIFFKPESMEYLLESSGYGERRRLKWDVDYGKGLAGGIKNRILGSLRLDGELRYLAYPR